MRPSPELCAEIIDSALWIVWTAAPDGSLDFVSSRWEELTGVPAERALGWGWLESVHPAERSRIRDRIRDRLRHGRLFDAECRLRLADGSSRWFLIRAVPLTRQGAGQTRWAGTFAEIDAQKRSEEELHQIDRRKNEFIATLAHELRNPLAPIRSSLDILRITGGSGPAAERAQAILERQVGTLVRLVDDLLEVSRAAGGRIELRRERVDLNAVIHVAVETSRPAIEAAGHKLSVNAPPSPFMVDLDPVRIAQVLTHLLNNAAQYTPPGGQIWLEARSLGDELVISVRDTGIGISSERLPRLFDLFTSLERHAQETGGSLGIGLALSRSMVEKHDGRIEARSEGAGRGSEFIVRLPLKVERAAPKTPESSAAWAVLSDRRVLVVDDSRDSADSLGILVRQLGADAHVCYDGPSAVDALETFRPTVVFLDLAMPGMDGYETARRMRLRPEFRDVTLIALTGWGQEEEQRRSKSAGFARHLLKPVDADALRALLLSLEASGLERRGISAT
jgi:PAS domain S-box-containing protein